VLDRPIHGPADVPSDQRQGKGAAQHIAIGLFVGFPFVAVLAAVPFAWGWGLHWRDVIIAGAMYMLTGHGISIGFHRYFVHGSFKATRPMRAILAVVGQAAIEGDVINWVADHRRHHKYSDKEGDPHSPWLYGDDWNGLTKGLYWAHYGWLYASQATSAEKYCPDILADKDIRKVHKSFGLIVAATFLVPAALGGLLTMSWLGFFTALFWAGFVRVALVQHVTWSINSICHTFGDTPFASRDQSRNVWWLAIPSLGESWHNLHHADPTAARHGVLKGQIDISARAIWLFEKAGWARDVRWPTAERIAAKRAA
jgi:stearoyl-CoA desaturase (delta-9 desaturase)